MGFVGSYGGASVTVDVTGGISVSPIPATEIGPQTKDFVNGSVFDMNVNGSVTPQYFDVAPGTGEVWDAEHITIAGDDTGKSEPEKFWAMAALTNGVQVDLIKDSVTYPVRNIKNNGDVVGTFNTRIANVGFNMMVGNTEFPWLATIELTGEDH